MIQKNLAIVVIDSKDHSNSVFYVSDAGILKNFTDHQSSQKQAEDSFDWQGKHIYVISRYYSHMTKYLFDDITHNVICPSSMNLETMARYVIENSNYAYDVIASSDKSICTEDSGVLHISENTTDSVFDLFCGSKMQTNQIKSITMISIENDECTCLIKCDENYYSDENDSKERLTKSTKLVNRVNRVTKLMTENSIYGKYIKHKG